MGDMLARPGDYRVICDRSGFKCWASETVVEPWTGLRVLARFADVRNPADTPNPIRPEAVVRDARPEGADVYQVTPVTPADL